MSGTTRASETAPKPSRTAAPALKIRRALIAVSDKTGVVEFAEGLAAHGVEIVSTSGTAQVLAAAGLAVRDVAELTGFAEFLDGRVKTLHPGVHGALLARRGDVAHEAALRDRGIAPIDLLAVNLYPFAATVASGADEAACADNIDIGGPAMLRAGAKNHAGVTVVSAPDSYLRVLEEMAAHGGATTLGLRQRLAQRAFAHVAAYDAAVSAWLAGASGIDAPQELAFAGALRQRLRYGENPHQKAALYVGGGGQGPATAQQVQGKTLSYNNINDADAAFALVADLDPSCAAAAIVKHANPCGAAQAQTQALAYDKALACDRVSAYGGVAAFNRELDAATAQALAGIFCEVAIAPGATAAARRVLAGKKNLRLLLTGAMPTAAGPVVRSVAGGFLVQDGDGARVTADMLRTVTRLAPTARQVADLLFAFQVCKHVKSNAIVYARDGAAVGIGAGQMSRVDAVRLAVAKAEAARTDDTGPSPACAGSVVASDAFFPFADGLEAAADAGAQAVIQPGGSRRDDEVIAAADARGLAMVFTGLRHFRH